MELIGTRTRTVHKARWIYPGLRGGGGRAVLLLLLLLFVSDTFFVFGFAMTLWVVV